jgi:hypothetical protein
VPCNPYRLAFDSRQQRFAASLTRAWEGSKLNETYNHPMSGAPKCIVIKKELERGREAETMLCPRLDETGAVKTIILIDDTAAKREASAANRTRWISESQSAAKAEREPGKCSTHHGYRLKRNPGSKSPIPMNSVKPLAARFYRLKSRHAPLNMYLIRFC